LGIYQTLEIINKEINKFEMFRGRKKKKLSIKSCGGSIESERMRQKEEKYINIQFRL